ncbi:hypothetical protein AQUCO_00200216v1 [Aquilegia coerulea]|uniref:S-protein homolog n=1 Tax=Aquilegia coerulea TaxID=218851 RepID=A0A2G5F230_AQUCA|nr:hypothetical protein AQUCO_00200216v1 [Aquilegia coerulea]
MVTCFNNTFKLFVVLIVLWDCSPIYGKTIYVSLRNVIRDDVTLYIYCKSKSDDLGPHILDYNQKFERSFRNSIWGYALISCSMKWMDYGGVEIIGYFDIYSERRDGHKCNRNCTLDAQYDGIWGYSSGNKPYMMYPWPRPDKA